ncbi:hypothetical protein CCH79_00005523 [Gambusia affinis]|uniref:Uncharacterized protein n=1 Tax=Gambusia affinis TaxID=33528 RepID=A0A315V5J8_GAMAF|nr:hypothetical protein CCH79_00005523 [Gambusia affinis]
MQRIGSHSLHRGAPLSEISREKMPGSESVRFGSVWMAPAVPVSRYCSLFLAHNRVNSQVNDVSAAKRGPRSRPFVPPRSPARLFAHSGRRNANTALLLKVLPSTPSPILQLELKIIITASNIPCTDHGVVGR